MKTAAIILLILPVLFTSFTEMTNPLHINGHLRKKDKADMGHIDRAVVFVKADGILLAKSTTDKKGNFEMDFIVGKQRSFDFFCFGRDMDTVLLRSIKRFESDDEEITFYLPKGKTNKDQQK